MVPGAHETIVRQRRCCKGGRELSHRRRWIALGVLAGADFLFVMDGLVVGVALPSIQRDFAIRQAQLGWVLNAYTIALGGFLLLGGRLSDLLGRRRVLVCGLALFLLASLGAGLAPATHVLVGARGLQGLGAALATAAAFSVVTTLFEEGEGRARALGVLSIVGSLGVVAGAVVGGVVTFTLGWRAVFLLNVPATAFLLLGGLTLVPESRDESSPRRVDIPGAGCVAATLTMTVAAIVLLEDGGTLWRTLALVGAALAFLGAFRRRQRRTPAPLIPPDFFQHARVVGVDVTAAFLPLGLGTCLFLGTLYMQNVLRYNAFKTGLTFLPLACALTVFSAVVPRLVAHSGARTVAATGFLTEAVGLASLALLLSPAASLWRVIVPGFVLVGVGAVASYVPIAERALEGVGERSGLASGVFNASQHVGNSLGIAVLATVAAWGASEDTARSERSSAAAGLELGFAIGALFMVTGAVLALVLVTRPPGSARDT